MVQSVRFKVDEIKRDIESAKTQEINPSKGEDVIPPRDRTYVQYIHGHIYK